MARPLSRRSLSEEIHHGHGFLMYESVAGCSWPGSGVETQTLLPTALIPPRALYSVTGSDLHAHLRPLLLRKLQLACKREPWIVVVNDGMLIQFHWESWPLLLSHPTDPVSVSKRVFDGPSQMVDRMMFILLC